MLRAELLRIAPDDHVLVLVVHHIVADGWSMSVIRRELGRLYAQGGDDAGLAAPPLRFSDCVRWQRDRFERDGLQAQLAYWRENLRELQTLNLPTDRHRPLQMAYEGRTLSLAIDPALAADLRALARQQDATAFTTLLAAFNVLLMRYTGQSDIAVGVPLAARNEAHLRDVVGYFANTVVMRNHLEGGSELHRTAETRARTARAALVTRTCPSIGWWPN